MFRLSCVILAISAVICSAQFEDQFFNWRQNFGPGGTFWPPGNFQRPPRQPEEPEYPPRGRDVETITERDREPLGPDFDWKMNPEVDASESVGASENRPSTVGALTPHDPFHHAFFPPGSFNFGESPFGVFTSVLRQRKTWWQGPNVCMEREELEQDDSDDKKDADEVTDADDKNVTSERLTSGTVPGVGASFLMFNGDATFESCTDNGNKYTCVKRKHSNGKSSGYIISYRCCHGYRRAHQVRDKTATKNPSDACVKVVLKPILEVVQDLGGKEFLETIRQAGLEEKISANNITIFVPSDEVLKSYERSSQNNLVEAEYRSFPDSHRTRRQADGLSPKELVLGHVTQGFIDLADLSNEEPLYSDNNNNTIRINIFPGHPKEYRSEVSVEDEATELEIIEKVRDADDTEVDDGPIVTANCARVLRKNIYATNGVVHTIDGLLTPVHHHIMDILDRHGEFTILVMVLQKTELDKMLSAEGTYTLFAPNDKAFEELDNSLRMKILNGDSCTLNILKHHILAHSLCSCAVPSRLHLTTHNMHGEVMTLKLSEPSKINSLAEKAIIVDDQAKITKADVIATNGVVHFIDKLILPESARPVSSQLQHQNFTKFHSLMMEADMLEYFDSLSNVTLFVPNDESFEKPENKERLAEISGDKDKLTKFLEYHVVKSEIESCDLVDDQKVTTARKGETVRINLYSTLPLFKQTYNRATANCARILHHDIKSCGTILHEIDRPLIPPTQNIQEMIESNPEFSILKKVIKDTDLEAILKSADDSLTFLAPDDEAFQRLSEDDLEILTKDKELATNILKGHIISDVLCCSGVGQSVWPFTEAVMTMARPLNINRDPVKGTVRIGSSSVKRCDVLATNGVVHTVNKVMVPVQTRRTSIDSDLLRHFMLY